jgi:hypothetical protein
VAHTKPTGEVPQHCAARGKKATHETAFSKPFHPELPAAAGIRFLFCYPISSPDTKATAFHVLVSDF